MHFMQVEVFLKKIPLKLLAKLFFNAMYHFFNNQHNRTNRPVLFTTILKFILAWTLNNFWNFNCCSRWMKTQVYQVLIVVKKRPVQSGFQAKQKGLSKKSQQLLLALLGHGFKSKGQDVQCSRERWDRRYAHHHGLGKRAARTGRCRGTVRE